MLHSLKTHPFAVEARFDFSLVLSFAIPREKLISFLPPCLELDEFENRWGFVAVAMVQTKGLRPKGWPSFLGNDFFLVGYRIFVRYETQAGKKLRGLYILRSETNRKSIETLGSIFTSYRYFTTNFDIEAGDERIRINSVDSGILVETADLNVEPALPKGSPFSSFKEARRFAGPLPFTFSFNRKNNRVLQVEGVRENWEPQPVVVNNYKIPFLDTIGIHNAQLANAFLVRDIPYYWKKGKTEKWQPRESPSRVSPIL